MIVTCALMDIRTSQAAMDCSRRHHTLQFTFMSHRSKLVRVVENPWKWCQFSVWYRSILVIDGWSETMTLFSGLGTDVHFWRLQWKDYLFEMQNAVEWRMVMSRG